MKQVLPLALLLVVSLTSACRKKPVAPTPVPTAPTEQSAKPPLTPVPTVPSAGAVPAATHPVSAPGVDRIEDRLPTAPPNSSKTSPIDRTLTEALQRYNEANGKMPADFSVLVTSKYLKALPTPPAGKFYALDRPHMQVVLLNQ
ncbi:MAG: hypothetical protein RL514_3870 [Verrucomicrobiota bacterium]